MTITVLANCDVNGLRPRCVVAQSPEGIYIGQQKGTFTVFTAHRGDGDVVFSGTLTIAPVTNGIRFSNVIPLKLDDAGRNVDKVRTTGEQRLQCPVNTLTSVPGGSFHPWCTVSMSLTPERSAPRRGGAAASDLPGSTGAHPASNPFTVSR